MGDRYGHSSATRPQFQIHWRTNAYGFTMIETIIVILVVGILAAIAAPSFLSWVRNKEVDDVLAQVVGALKEAQSEALKTGKGCRVEIDTSNLVVRATIAASSPSPPKNCLPTGNREFSASNRDLKIYTNFDNSNELIFTYKKTTPNAGIVVLAQSEASKQRCLVVSAGVGLIRTGYYQGDPTATLSDTNCQHNP